MQESQQSVSQLTRVAKARLWLKQNMAHLMHPRFEILQRFSLFDLYFPNDKRFPRIYLGYDFMYHHSGPLDLSRLERFVRSTNGVCSVKFTR